MSGTRIRFLFTIMNRTFQRLYPDYRENPKFSDRQVWVNSADPDQTAHQGLHCLPFRMHRCSNFMIITAIFSGVRIFRIFMV